MPWPSKLLCALTHSLQCLRSTFACALSRLSSSLADLSNCLTGALTDVLDRALAALADVFHAFTGLIQHLVGSTADVFNRLADAFEKFRIAVEGGQHPGENRRDIVQAGLEQRLGLDALNIQLNLAEPGGYAHVELDQVLQLRSKRDRSAQVINLDVDLVDLDDGHHEHHIRSLVDLLWIEDVVVGVLLLLALA